MNSPNHIFLEDCITGMQKLEAESVDLIIADPPYFKVVKQNWDFKWRTEEDYIEWSKQWLIEAHRVLRKGGTLYLFGFFRILALLLPHLEEMGFETRQQIIINKGMRSVTGRATKNYKMFPNVTESIMFLIKDSKPYVKDLLKSRQQELGLTSKAINEGLGVKSNGGGMWSIYTGNNVCKKLPTEEIWSKLQDILQFDVPYDKVKITFNKLLGYTDVWDDINFYEEKRIHPTQKPIKLIDRLVLTSSNEGDTVLDPFVGSGSTIISCLEHNRNYIGFELDEDYHRKTHERIEEYFYRME
jgi:DNA modification methylase